MKTVHNFPVTVFCESHDRLREAAPARLTRLAGVAGSFCTEALERLASETVQLHGGIAITWEHDAQLVFKRAHALSQLHGPAHHLRTGILER